LAIHALGSLSLYHAGEKGLSLGSRGHKTCNAGYLETRFAEIESGDSPDNDPWNNFKDYCSQHDLNWRVIRKMIEFSINTPFESERELANHESFKSLEKIEDEPVTVLETKRTEPAKECLVDLFLD